MPGNMELRATQKRMLYALKKLEQENEQEVKGLRELIKASEVEMDAEDVAYVEKKLSEA